MDIKVERPKDSNFEEISNLFAITLDNNFREENILDPNGSLKNNLVIDLVNTLKLDFESNGEKEYHLVAKMNDVIIGIIAFGKTNKLIEDNVDLKSANTPELKSVYITPEFQNCGVGNLLLKSIINQLIKRGYTEFYLDSGYLNAQRYWKRKFGNPTITLENYWSPNNHHMIWNVKMNELSDILINKE